jgi:hypothetical protein
MIRTVWLAAACLAVLGVVAVGKTLTAPATLPPSEMPVDRTTVGAGLGQEAMIKADRLEISYVREEGPTQPGLQPIDPIIPQAQKAISPPETHIISRHWHDTNALNSSAPKTRQTITVRKGKAATDSRGSQITDRSKPGEQVTRCDQTIAFRGLLISLNLAPACDSQVRHD